MENDADWWWFLDYYGYPMIPTVDALSVDKLLENGFV